MGKTGSAVTWMDWDVFDVGKWMKGRGLERYAVTFVENGIAGENLPDCLDENKLAELVDEGFWRKKIIEEISQLVWGSDLENHTKATGSKSTAKTEGRSSKPLPSGKLTHFFGSHQKEHSVYGDTSESLGIRIKDVLEAQFGLKGWFDLDDLKTIDVGSIEAGICSSCCLVVLLTNETKKSKWCRKEWQLARDNDIPVIVVVDIDKFPSRPLIKEYIEAGYDWLFQNQVVNYSSTHRKACYGMIAQAIEAVVSQTLSHVNNDHSTATKSTDDVRRIVQPPHEDKVTKAVHARNMDLDTIKAQLKLLISRKYGDVSSFFDSAKGQTDNSISRKQWKKALRQLGLELTDAARKQLRKSITSSKTISLRQLIIFVGDATDVDGTCKSTGSTLQQSHESEQLCIIPLEVPDLPAKFHRRDAPLEALIASLIKDDSATVSLTAPKSRNAITSQGMGGCGKTTMTIAAVNDSRVRSHFERIAWHSISQTPNIGGIQAKLFEQLFQTKISDEVAGNVGLAFQTLVQESTGRTFLVVLDDVWDLLVEKQLNFLDKNTPSRLLISTRIRQLVPDAAEVQLALLSTQESVEMLMLMSGLSYAADSSSELLQITRICGNLPLTIGVAAGMIKSFGSEWRQNVLGMLQENTGKSMADEAEGLSPAAVIVTRSVEELELTTQRLFTLLGVVPEDIQCPLPIITLVWVSGSQKEDAKQGARLQLQVRKMVMVLLRYNLALGTLENGIYYHDIVRDVARSALHPDLHMYQRKFVAVVAASSNSGAVALQDYLNLALKTHMIEGVAPGTDLKSDPTAISWLESAADPWDLTPVVVRTATHLFGSERLIEMAERNERENEMHLAARRLLLAASTMTTIHGGHGDAGDAGLVVRVQQRACDILASSEIPQSRALELMARGNLLFTTPWGDPYQGMNNKRLEALIDCGTILASARDTARLGCILVWTSLSDGGFTANGSGNHLNASSLREFSLKSYRCMETCRRAAEMQENNDDPVALKIFVATIGGNAAAMGTSLYAFPDDCNTELSVLPALYKWAVKEYNYEAHSERNGSYCNGMEQFGILGRDAFLIDGDIETQRGLFQKILALLEGGIWQANPSQFNPMHFSYSPMMHSCFLRTGIDRDVLQRFSESAGFTFNKSDTAFQRYDAGIAPVRWQTEKYQYCSADFFPRQAKLRHWLLARHRIDPNAFRAWLAAPASVHTCQPIETTGMSTGLLCDGDGAEVFESLDEIENAIKYAKIDIEKLPFNPFLKNQSLTALGRCHTKQGRPQEAAAAFQNAITEAHRCKIKLFEFIAIADSIACSIGGDDNDSDSDQVLLREYSNEMGIAPPEYDVLYHGSAGEGNTKEK